MADAFLWIQEQWFNAVQTVGILGGMLLTRAALRREVQARRLSDHLALVGHHRELWIDAHRRPELARVFMSEVDLIAAPISVMEEEFLNLVIVHFSTGWIMARQDSLIELPLLKSDARSFFSLPIPRAVWERTTHFRDPKFAQFIEEALAPPDKHSSNPRIREKIPAIVKKLLRLWGSK